tara:strand:+ start:127 stop:435 length:309 start_codon:yes stop_codon:yes gene_type:complete
MPDKFGQISTGAMSDDDSTHQGFLDVEKHLNSLNERVISVEDDLVDYKIALRKESYVSLSGLDVTALTAASSTADIATANKALTLEVVTALQKLIANVKGLS